MLKDWMERNLQEPFYQAEIYKAGINLEDGANKDFGTIKTLAVFGTAYIAFCAYSYAKYVA
jgi:hypothetical protein